MRWEHFEPKKSGTCQLQKTTDNTILSGEYERGIVTTGKSRVFHGYYVRVDIDGETVTGFDPIHSESYHLALQNCNAQLAEKDLRLLVAGNVPEYSESAMSGGSGYGYLPGHKKAIDIMTSYPLDNG
ncbi:hypothetical protein CKO12_11370 [Chromatium okenii]|uniref:hypothetical protein n=1 Tax=Chromatium okenii TaxID=61644 RepID=UPI0019076526|nr:hypothetical protein [Chromatium okenii]MBK1642466.1 hypothetical protein [Chromatium okenii]